MKHSIDINLIKENPGLFFSKLPKKAEAEIADFLQFIVFKYNISFISENDTNNFELTNTQDNTIVSNALSAFAAFRTGLPLNYKFSRDEANER
jgi:hypothetical protein